MVVIVHWTGYGFRSQSRLKLSSFPLASSIVCLAHGFASLIVALKLLALKNLASHEANVVHCIVHNFCTSGRLPSIGSCRSFITQVSVRDFMVSREVLLDWEANLLTWPVAMT